MAQLQMTAEEEKSAYRSALSIVPSAEETSPSEIVNSASSEEIPITAYPVRPDEFMAAIAAIDARKNKKAAGTVPLGDALDQIQANVTPDEVWLEVYAERLKARKLKGTLKANAAQRRKRFWLRGISLTTILITAVLLRLFMGNASLLAKPATTEAIPAPQEIASNNSSIPVSTTIALAAPKPIPLVHLLRDGGMVRMRLENLSGLRATLNRALNGDVSASAALSKAIIDPSQYTGSDWMVYFHNGTPYLRGWIVLPPNSNKVQLLAQQVQIFNSYDHPSIKPGTGQPITVPVDGIHNYSSYSDGTSNAIQARLTHLDGEAWKGWQPLPTPTASGLPSSQSGAEL